MGQERMLNEGQKTAICEQIESILRDQKEVNGDFIIKIQNAKVVCIEWDCKVQGKQDLSNLK